MKYILPKKQQRQFLADNFDPLNKDKVSQLIEKLIKNPPSDFKSAKWWYGNFHELSCAISERQTILEVNYNLENTQNNELKIVEFEKNILSQLLDCREKMLEIYLSSPFKYSMHAFENGKIEKDLIARKQFSKQELSNLQINENDIIRKYKKFTHNSKALFKGKSILISSIIGHSYHSNIDTRKESFFSYWQFIKENENHYQSLFDDLLKNRRQQAKIAGCLNYTKIAFAELGRFDYGEKECALLRESILKVVVPVINKLSLKQAVSLKEQVIKPWNSQIWPSLTPRTPPSGGSLNSLKFSMQKLMNDIHPLFGKLFENMDEMNLINVFPIKGKSPGAFSVTFQESGVPFLFGNFGANLRDMFTFIHEFGHCLHGYAISSISNILLRQPSFEVCELASIGLELLSSAFMDKIWEDPLEAKKVLKYQFFQMLQFWPFMAMMDEWQHEVYSCPDFMPANERNALWLKLSHKYKSHINWSECPEFEALGWLSRPHIFTSPFYFVDYGIAQIGALQLWQLSQQNFSLAVENYIKGLSLGAQLDVPALYKEIGVKFDFSQDLLEKICTQMVEEILK